MKQFIKKIWQNNDIVKAEDANRWENGIDNNENTIIEHVSDNTRHITNDERHHWNAKVTQNELTTAINTRAPSSHTHAINEVANLQTQLDHKLNITANAMSASRIQPINITSQIVDLNALNRTNGHTEGVWVSNTDGGTNNIAPLPAHGRACRIELQTMRDAGISDYRQMMTVKYGFDNTEWIRFCVSGSWSSWVLFRRAEDAERANRLAFARNITLSGDTNGSMWFDGGGNANMTTFFRRLIEDRGNLRYSIDFGGIRIEMAQTSVLNIPYEMTVTPVEFEKPFASRPMVFTDSATSVPYVTVLGVAPSDITTTGFRINSIRTNATNTAVMWLAIGPSASINTFSSSTFDENIYKEKVDTLEKEIEELKSLIKEQL